METATLLRSSNKLLLFPRYYTPRNFFRLFSSSSNPLTSRSLLRRRCRLLPLSATPYSSSFHFIKHHFSSSSPHAIANQCSPDVSTLTDEVAAKYGFEKVSEEFIGECKSRAVSFKRKKTGAEVMLMMRIKFSALFFALRQSKSSKPVPPSFTPELESCPNSHQMETTQIQNASSTGTTPTSTTSPTSKTIAESTNTGSTTDTKGGRVLDQFRSSLSPATVQALICCQNWLHHGSIPTDSRSLINDLETYENLESEFGAKLHLVTDDN